jgi:hypothetical protein
MTDKVVDFQSRLAARKVEYAEYDKRMQHLGALFEMMDPVISKMRELGADEGAIARALRVIVEELEALEPRRPGRLEFFPGNSAAGFFPLWKSASWRWVTVAGARTCSTRLPSFRGFPTRAAGLGLVQSCFSSG